MHAGIRAAAQRFGGNFGRLPDEAEEPPLEGRARAGVIKLAYLGWPGDGPPMLLLHGLDGNPWCWARTAPLLARRRRVIAPALRGHGRSDTPAGDYRFEAISTDLVRFLDELGLERVVLGGHSWGGKVATHLAAQHPDRVAALVLVDPAAPGPHHPLFRVAPFLMETALAPERKTWPDEAAWREGQRELVFLRWRDETDRRLWREMYLVDDAGRYRPRLPQDAFEAILYTELARDLRPLLPRISAPTLLLRPTLTVSPFPSQVRAFREGLSNLREGRVEGDHNCQYSNPVDTAAAIEAFLADLPS